MNNLTLARSVRPVDSEKMGHYLIEYLTHSKTFPQVLLPSTLRESEGHSPEAWSRGWPLATAERAASPSAEGWREFQREVRERIAMHGSLPLSEHQETPANTSARSSGVWGYPLTISSPHWSSKVTSRRARTF
jgi:hypothetical protein